jgi:hypothetical protein
MAFTIEVIELEDATGFKLYDLTDWVHPFDHDLVTSVILTVEYDSVIYTYTSPAGLLTDLGMDATYNNLCGPALNSYFVVTPDHLMNGAVPLNTTYIPDGFYEITLTCTHNAIVLSDLSRQGFLAEAYMMASKLPLQIDPDNFDYEENRLQFLCIAMLRSATWAADLGRVTEFETLVEKVNDFLDARSINEIWST